MKSTQQMDYILILDSKLSRFSKLFKVCARWQSITIFILAVHGVRSFQLVAKRAIDMGTRPAVRSLVTGAGQS
eukprot:scaffold18915_cov26-Cyclotella_meneghiniana.AAC.2